MDKVIHDHQSDYQPFELGSNVFKRIIVSWQDFPKSAIETIAEKFLAYAALSLIIHSSVLYNCIYRIASAKMNLTLSRKIKKLAQIIRSREATTIDITKQEDALEY